MINVVFQLSTPTARRASMFDNAKCSSFWGTRSGSIFYSKAAHSSAYNSKSLPDSHPTSMHQLSVLLRPRENLNEDHEFHLGTTNPLPIRSQNRYQNGVSNTLWMNAFSISGSQFPSVCSQLFSGNGNFSVMPAYKLFASVITLKVEGALGLKFGKYLFATANCLLYIKLTPPRINLSTISNYSLSFKSLKGALHNFSIASPERLEAV